MKKKGRKTPKTDISGAIQQRPDDLTLDAAGRQRRLERVFWGLLVVAGVYLSIVYFGQKAVPNSDFSAFVNTGRQILHFQAPSSFKRVPVLGMLQVLFSKFMFTSPYPMLTGGLVLNGVLYVCSIVLFYRVSRFFLEPAGAFCLSLVGALNPWSLKMLVDPIAETAIVFFLLLTLYLILKRSRWCYLAAMLASMTRYELFGLIGIALLFDLFALKTKRQKLTAVGMAFAAAVPMILWLIGTKMSNVEAGGHYFRVFLNVEDRNGFKLLKMLWHTSFSSLLQWPEWIRAILVSKPTTQAAANAIQTHTRHFQTVWNVLMSVGFISGVVWVFLKKQWTFLCILLFWAGYVCIHMSQSVLIDRYTVPVVWLTLLTAAYGLKCSKDWIAGRVPKGVLYAAAVLAAVAAAFWAMSLWPALSRTGRVSSASATVVYAGLFLLAAGLAVKQLLLKRKTLFGDICLLFAVGVMVVSNQFALSMQLGQGDLDVEFRKTAQWYRENAQDGGKLATSLPGVVNLFMPEGEKNAIHTRYIAGENLLEFAQSCKKQNVEYVAWDSRLGFATRDYYYQEWGLKKIHPLGSGKDVGPFKFITKIEGNARRYIYLYRLEFDELPSTLQ